MTVRSGYLSPGAVRDYDGSSVIDEPNNIRLRRPADAIRDQVGLKSDVKTTFLGYRGYERSIKRIVMRRTYDE